MLALSACLSPFGAAADAQTIDYGAGPFCFYGANKDTAWSSTGTSRGTGWTQWVDGSEVYNGVGPNSSKAQFYFQHDQTGIKVDGEYTIGYGYTNPDMASAKGEIFVNMSGTTETGEDGVLNYVGDENVAPEFANVGFSRATHHMTQAMMLASKAMSRSIIYSGGTVNMLDSLGRVAVLGLYASIADKPADGGCYTLSMKFQNGNILNAANGLVLDGGRYAYNNNAYAFSSVFVFESEVNIGTADSGTGRHNKDLVIGTGAAGEKNNTSGTYAIQTIFGDGDSECTVNAGGIVLNENTSAVFKNGAVVTLGGTSSTKYGGIRMNCDDSLNRRTSNTAKTYLEIQKGATIATPFLLAGAGSEILINGAINANSHRGGCVISATNAEITFGADATLRGAYSTAAGLQFSGTVTSNAQKGTLEVSCSDQLDKQKLGLIRMNVTSGSYASQNTKLVLNTSDAFYFRNKTQKEVVLQFMTANSAFDVEVNANQNFDSLRFNATGITVNLVLDASVDEFNLTSLADGTLSGSNTLVIDGFREGVIKIDSWNDGDLLANIVSKNGDWVDFVYDNTTGYLSATHVVPEPATVAAFFGLFALGFALYRRRRY